VALWIDLPIETQKLALRVHALAQTFTRSQAALRPQMLCVELPRPGTSNVTSENADMSIMTLSSIGDWTSVPRSLKPTSSDPSVRLTDAFDDQMAFTCS
jgi:hypothetical protein